MKKFVIFTEYGRKIGNISANYFSLSTNKTHYNFYVKKESSNELVAKIPSTFAVIDVDMFVL